MASRATDSAPAGSVSDKPTALQREARAWSVTYRGTFGNLSFNRPDSSTATYIVTVTVASLTAKALTSFSFASPVAAGVINESAKTVSVTVPFGTTLTALVATFTTTGASVKVSGTLQFSGTTPNNFTSPVSYVVTTADNSTATYVVTVTIASASAKAITSFGLVSPAVAGDAVAPNRANVTNMMTECFMRSSLEA